MKKQCLGFTKKSRARSREGNAPPFSILNPPSSLQRLRRDLLLLLSLGIFAGDQRDYRLLKMDYVIHPLTAADEPILWEMLYQALRTSQDAPPRDIVRQPEYARHVEGWGRPGDFALACWDCSRNPIEELQLQVTTPAGAAPLQAPGGFLFVNWEKSSERPLAAR